MVTPGPDREFAGLVAVFGRHVKERLQALVLGVVAMSGGMGQDAAVAALDAWLLDTSPSQRD